MESEQNSFELEDCFIEDEELSTGISLDINKFDEFALRHGFKNGCQLVRELGYHPNVYGYLKFGGRVDSDFATAMFERFGEDSFDVLDYHDGV